MNWLNKNLYYLLNIRFNSFNLVVFLVFTTTFQVESQSITTLNPGFNDDVRVLYYDSTSNILYAGGQFSNLHQGMTVNYIAQWNGLTWDTLNSGVNDDQMVTSIISYNGDIIVGGTFQSVGGGVSKGLAKWDGTNWHELVDAVTFQGYSCVLTLYTNNSELFVGGCFDSINGIAAQGIARYDGVNWYSYPNFGGTFHYVQSIIFYKNELYVAGNFNAGTGKADIIKFDGTDWVTVGGGLTGPGTMIYDMEIYNDTLFICGYFQNAFGDPGNNIASWDGFNWNQPGNGLQPGSVYSMEVNGNKLFAGGIITDASGMSASNIAIWDGSIWTNFYGNNIDNGVITIESNGSDLYFAGGFQNVNSLPFNRVAKVQLNSNLNVTNQDCLTIQPTIAIDEIVVISNCFQNNYQVTIYNKLGQSIYNSFERANSYKQIDISAWNNGIYFVQIKSYQFVDTKKFIKN